MARVRPVALSRACCPGSGPQHDHAAVTACHGQQQSPSRLIPRLGVHQRLSYRNRHPCITFQTPQYRPERPTDLRLSDGQAKEGSSYAA
jgi:hypothetical protein